MFLGEALEKGKEGGKKPARDRKEHEKVAAEGCEITSPFRGFLSERELYIIVTGFLSPSIHPSVRPHTRAERDECRQRNSPRPAMVARAQPDRKQLPLVLLRLLCLLPTGLPVRSVDFTRGTDNITVRQGDTAILR